MMCDHEPKYCKGLCRLCYSRSPTVKARAKAYRDTLEMKAHAKAHNHLPHVMAYKRAYQKAKYHTPDGNAYHKNYNHRADVKAKALLTYRLNKLKHVQALGGKCIWCGYNVNLASLHLHHKDRTQKESTKETCKKTIDYGKFILLCGNCHMEEHWPEQAINHAKARNMPIMS